jgi:hypothetical protein
MVQLPGHNTPQFDHGRAKTPGHPQPVAPVYQPEVAADAIHFAAAAAHRRRQIYIGVPTYYTVLGSKFAPWLAELYLARTAVSGQQTDGPPDAQNRARNLMEPPPGDPGAHGPFDEDAHGRSPLWWASKHQLGTRRSCPGRQRRARRGRGAGTLGPMSGAGSLVRRRSADRRPQLFLH